MTLNLSCKVHSNGPDAPILSPIVPSLTIDVATPRQLGVWHFGVESGTGLLLRELTEEERGRAHELPEDIFVHCSKRLEFPFLSFEGNQLRIGTDRGQSDFGYFSLALFITGENRCCN
jgi:hypothetical protein